MSTETPADQPAGAPSTAVFPPADREALAALLAPYLRPLQRTPGIEDLSDGDVLIDARPHEVIDALFAAGLLVHDDATDRAHLRKGWAAMSTALVHLAEGRPLDTAVLAAVPRSHQVYLLGHQARGERLGEAWITILAARDELAAILARGTAPSPLEVGAVLETLGGDNPYGRGRPADADPWWGCWTDEAALPEDYDWERYTRTIDPDAQLDGLGDLCAFLGGTWSDKPEAESITAKVLKLIVKAQATPDKFARICRAFPREAAAWRTWMTMVDHMPTARELYTELVAGLPAPASARVAERHPAVPFGEHLLGEGRPGPVYAGDPAQLPGLIVQRVCDYARTVGKFDPRGGVPVDRAQLPRVIGGGDLQAQIPDGARAYALPWPAGARALYNPVDGVVLSSDGPDAEVIARSLFMPYGPCDAEEFPLGVVRRLTDEDKARGSRWWECRHCRMGAVGAVSVAAEQAECLGHEAVCPDQDKLRNTGIPAGEDRHA
jgi:hypothetical protein